MQRICTLRQSQYQYWFIGLHFKTDKPFTGSLSFIHLGSHIQNHIPSVRPLWLISIFTNLASGTTDQPLARTNKWPTTTAEDQGSFATSRCYCRCGWTSNPHPARPTTGNTVHSPYSIFSSMSILWRYCCWTILRPVLFRDLSLLIFCCLTWESIIFLLAVVLTRSPFLFFFFSAKFVTPIFAT